MTNYNERLDEILHDIIHIGYVQGFNQIAHEARFAPYNHIEPITIEEAKQAITSLIKELVAEREYSIEVYFDDGKDKVKMEKATVKVMPPRNIFSIPIDRYRSVKVVVQELTKGEEEL